MNAHARFPAVDGFEVEHDFEDIGREHIGTGLMCGSNSGIAILIGEGDGFVIDRISLDAYGGGSVVRLKRPKAWDQSQDAIWFRELEAAILTAGKAKDEFWHQFEQSRAA